MPRRKPAPVVEPSSLSALEDMVSWMRRHGVLALSFPNGVAISLEERAPTSGLIGFAAPNGGRFDDDE